MAGRIIVLQIQFSDPKGGIIPQLGFGTYEVAPDSTQQIVETALELGYRYIDTARICRNEAKMGTALAVSGIPRSEIFLTIKLDNPSHAKTDARRGLKESLEKLRADYVDLFLIHWPMPDTYGGRYPDYWRLLLDSRDVGLVHHVGVSSFQMSHLQQFPGKVGEFPAVNQTGTHPWFANNKVRGFTRVHGEIVEAWSPPTRGRFFDDLGLRRGARRSGCMPAQLVLRWTIDQGDVVFPKSDHRGRMQESLGTLEVQLDARAGAVLDNLDRGEAGRTGSHPDKVNWLRK